MQDAIKHLKKAKRETIMAAISYGCDVTRDIFNESMDIDNAILDIDTVLEKLINLMEVLSNGR